MRKILGLTRYAVVVPAIASMIGALLLMVQGSIEILMVVFDSIFKGSYLKVTIVDVLTAVDAILLGTVLLVIGFGLYELFVFVGVFVDANRAADVVAYGVGAGALVAGLALFAYATKKPGSESKGSAQASKQK